jgi:hypothetical protein
MSGGLTCGLLVVVVSGPAAAENPLICRAARSPHHRGRGRYRDRYRSATCTAGSQPAPRVGDRHLCAREALGRSRLWAVGCGVGWSGAGPREGSPLSHAAATGCPERATHTSPGQRPGGTAYPPIPRPLKGRGHRAVCEVQYVAPLQGGPGSTGGRASVDAGTGLGLWEGHGWSRLWAVGLVWSRACPFTRGRVWPAVEPWLGGLTCGLLVVVVSGLAAPGTR